MAFGRKSKTAATVPISGEPGAEKKVDPEQAEDVLADVPADGTLIEKSADPVAQKTDEVQVHKREKKKKKKRPRRHGDVILKRQETIDILLKYQLGQPELKRLNHDFKAVDQDNTGIVNFDEFFAYVGEKRTKFTDGIFTLLNLDLAGSMTTEEFVEAVITYGMYTREEILRFVFDSFDADGSGSIDEEEFRILCNTINDNKPIFPGNFKKALAESDRNGDGLIDFDEFQKLNKRYPLILFPCFRLQSRIHKTTLSEKHWLKLAKRYCTQLKLQEYKRKHNGVEKRVSFWQKVQRIFGIGVIDIYQQ